MGKAMIPPFWQRPEPAQVKQGALPGREVPDRKMYRTHVCRRGFVFLRYRVACRFSFVKTSYTSYLFICQKN
jgi:hypothetical protein